MNLKLALAFLAPLLAVTAAKKKCGPKEIPTEHLCQDSVLSFSLGNNNQRNCFWVSQEDSENRCANGNVKTHCPKTCGLCDDDPNYCANTEMPFLVYIDDKGYTSKTCYWVGKDPSMTDSRCTNKAGLKETCPETCGLC